MYDGVDDILDMDRIGYKAHSRRHNVYANASNEIRHDDQIH